MSGVSRNARLEHPLVRVAVLVVAAFGTYALALGNGFAYDDVVIVSNDVRVTGQQWGAIFTKPYWAASGFALYRPLVSLSFAADWAVSGGNPAWFHAVNGLWHATASVALFALLRAWFTPLIALLAALLFAVHPVHVEAVANIVGRSELMAATFFLTACALWAHEWPRVRWARLAAISVLYVLAVLSKESAATLPAVLFLIDGVRQRWTWSKMPLRLRACLPEFATLALLLAGLLLLRSAITGGATPAELDPIMEVTTGADFRIRSALQIWPHIIRLLLLPIELLADYGPRVLLPAEVWSPLAAAGLVILMALIAGGILLIERCQHMGALLLLWLPVTMLPVANLLFPIGVLLAERTLYLPSVAVCIGLALLIRALQQVTPARMRWFALGGAIVLLLAVVRVQIRIPDWDSTDTILMAQRRDRPDSFRAAWHAARMARRDGRPEQAIEQYQQAMQLWPHRERLALEAAAYLSQKHQLAGALRIAQYGAQKWPDNLHLHRLVASIALDLSDTATARRALKQGLQLDPHDDLLSRMAEVLNTSRHD